MECNVNQNLNLFREMVNCHAQVSLWTYDRNCELLESTCPCESMFDKFLAVMGHKEYLSEYAKEHTAPLNLGTAIGLSWLAAFDWQNGELQHIYLLGPVFTTEVSFDSIGQILNTCPGASDSLAWKNRLLDEMAKLPVISPLVWNEYACMFHYCITGEKIGISSIGRKHHTKLLTSPTAARKDRHQVWLVEQNLLRMIREGDLNYKDGLNRSGMVSNGVPVRTKDPLRQAKDSVIVSISLCTRAAIQGGLSPEQAYSLGDTYIQAVEDARTTADVATLHGVMFDDFIHRVHDCRTNPDVSKQIRICCDYIETHAEEKLTIDMLARMVGYTEYYLSRKFKAEVHVSINDYIKIAKVERAKYLLSTTDSGIQEIADQLNFCSRSHFGEVFRKIVGCSPVDYREKL